MPTTFMIAISAFIWTAWAAAAENMTAAYISIGVHALVYLLHAIEVKLNRLLDHHGIHVSKQEISQSRN